MALPGSIACYGLIALTVAAPRANTDVAAANNVMSKTDLIGFMGLCLYMLLKISLGKMMPISVS